MYEHQAITNRRLIPTIQEGWHYGARQRLNGDVMCRETCTGWTSLAGSDWTQQVGQRCVAAVKRAGRDRQQLGRWVEALVLGHLKQVHPHRHGRWLGLKSTGVWPVGRVTVATSKPPGRSCRLAYVTSSALAHDLCPTSNGPLEQVYSTYFAPPKPKPSLLRFRVLIPPSPALLSY